MTLRENDNVTYLTVFVFFVKFGQDVFNCVFFKAIFVFLPLKVLLLVNLECLFFFWFISLCFLCLFLYPY